MGDENHICTLGDYSKPSHEGYRNIIELPVENNVYCMEDPEQAFVEYASSRTDEVGGKWYTFKPEQNNLGDIYNPSWRIHPNLRFNNRSNLEGLVSNFMASQDARLSKFEADFKQQQSEMTNKIDTVLKAITDQIAELVPPSSNTKLIYTKEEDDDVMFIEIISKDDNSCKEEPEAEGQEVEYFDIFPTKSELAYHKNEDDKRRGVEYVMSKILGFYKECLELGLEYLTGMDDEGEVM
ncbi:hypothetical protein Tco_0535267 [Tanacetum coccineum]